ncbi:MAG: hypothetical protein JST92_19695 [Deltaproteobacteria bacterium]|nr:hypothetical protein [Deltaproteobacteria bacterium]
MTPADRSVTDPDDSLESTPDRFISPGTEAGYRRWSAARAAPLARTGATIGLICCSLGLASLRAIGSPQFGDALRWVVLVMVPFLGMEFVLASRPAALLLVPALSMVTTAVIGVSMSLLFMILLDLPAMALARSPVSPIAKSF